MVYTDEMVYLPIMLVNKKKSFIEECQGLEWGLWQCPPFLFMIMGAVTIICMIAIYILAGDYVDEPELGALVVIFVATLLFLVGNIVVANFTKVMETSRLKTEFLSIVSHQLRSPLSIFKWTLDVLDRDLKGIAREASSDENFLQTLRITLDNMVILVNTLLDVSRIEAKTFRIKAEEFDLGKETQEIMQNFSKYAQASNVKIDLDLEKDLPGVLGDKERIAIVIRNLLDNAIRYTENSGKALVKIAREKNMVHWSVQDQGIGIPPEDKDKIFQKFSRAGNVKASGANNHGTGIGLYISHEVIKASGGTIGFTSELGKGSTFWFTLPAAAGHT